MMMLRACLSVSLFLLASSFAGADGPLKVYVLVGQSNMQGHAQVSTFDAIGLDPNAASLLASMRDADGDAYTCERVWISSIGNDGTEKEYLGKLTTGYGAAGRGPKIGPEFMFGITMEQSTEQPVLVIKTAWGGKSLHTDFRPPSSGTYEFTEEQLEKLRKRDKNVEEEVRNRTEASGHYYRLMLKHVKEVLQDLKRVCPDYDPDAGYELSGFVWFQGWNDMVDSGVYPNRDKPGGYADYSKLMGQFIRDVRRDLDAPQLPFVIGVMGVGGPIADYGPDRKRVKSVHENFRSAMAAPSALPEFEAGVAAVYTENAWDTELAELKGRGSVLQAKSKELGKNKSLTRQQREAELQRLRSELYSERDEQLLTGSSNAEYHYLGSAKIMARIGKAFAEAMLELEESR